MDESRRGFFAFLAGAFAAPAVARLDFVAEQFTKPTMAFELNAIVRRAFVPSIYVRLYNQHPALSLLMERAS